MTEATITIRTDARLKRQFLERIGEKDRNVSQVFRDFMRAVVSQHGDTQLYDDWFRGKVQEALDDTQKPIPSATVERRFAKKRAAALRKHAKR